LKRFNFDKYAWGSTVLNQGSKYDYASVMHYETTAFSTNGRPTMIPRRAGVTIGDAQELSPTDIAEVRHFYGCTA
jgi:astacin